MARIVIERTDGGVSVMDLDEDADLPAEIAKWAAGSGLRAASWHPAGELPADRIFRDAWHHAGDGRVAVHMDRARVIHLGRIRAARNAALADLDLSWMRAAEKGDQPGAAAIARRKQALRDLPATLDLTQHATPEALAAAWPVDLPR